MKSINLIISTLIIILLSVNVSSSQELSKKERKAQERREKAEREALSKEYRSYEIIMPVSMEIQKRFCKAIREHDMVKATTYLEAGASVNYFEGAEKNIPVVKYNYKYPICTGIGELADPMTIAAANSDQELVAFLVNNGAKPKYSMALFAAIMIQDTSMLNLLVQLGADINLRTSPTYWWSAVREKDRGIFPAFFGTPLEFALKHKKIQSVNQLLKMGAKPNCQYVETHLLKEHNYFTYDNAQILTAFLIENYDCNLNIATQRNPSSGVYNSRSPLMMAVKNNSFHLVKILVEKGANINFSDPYFSVLDLAVIRKDNMDMVKFLVENGADVNHTSQKGLMDSGRISILERAREEYKDYLIEKGAR